MLDGALSNQPQDQHCADQAEQRGQGQHGVEAGEEPLGGRVGGKLPGLWGDRGEGLVSVAGMLSAGAWLSPSRRLRLMVPLAAWTLAPLLGFAARPGLIPAMALLVLSGLGWAYSIGLDQRLLEATPEHLRGRTLSLATSGLMLANGLGFAAAGAAAELASPQAVIVASGLAGLLVVTLLARPITANLRQAARHPSAG